MSTQTEILRTVARTGASLLRGGAALLDRAAGDAPDAPAAPAPPTTTPVPAPAPVRAATPKPKPKPKAKRPGVTAEKPVRGAEPSPREHAAAGTGRTPAPLGSKDPEAS